MHGRLLARLALLALPFAAVAAVVLAVDPYDVAGSPLIPDAIKLRSAAAFNPVLWTLSRYRRAPRAHILLGDSRMGNLGEDSVAARTGAPVANLAFGGASLDEVMSAFWIADAKTRLTAVDMAVGFSQYSDYEHADRTGLFRTLEDQPLLYVISRTVLRATALTLQAAISGTGVETHPRDHEAFWATQMDAYGDHLFGVYRHPDAGLAGLTRIAAHCRERGIRLRFVILPTHQSLRDRLAAYRLEGEFERFKRELAALATTIDFDYPNELTMRKENFVDPVHVVPAVNRRLADELWAGTAGIGRRKGP